MSRRKLTHGSLFSGIGGFDLGFERAGIETVWQVEKDPAARTVLGEHWPDVRRHAEIETFPPTAPADWSCDIISFGWPCQDCSFGACVSKRRQGLLGERSGLLYQAVRVLRLVKPTWFVAENVSGLASANEGSAGWWAVAAFSEIGYSVAWRLVDMRALGIPQHRRRFIFVGHSDPRRAARVLLEPEGKAGSGKQATGDFVRCVIARAANHNDKRNTFVVGDTPSDVERAVDVARFSKLVDSRLIGNAFPPPAAEWLGRRIIEASE